MYIRESKAFWNTCTADDRFKIKIKKEERNGLLLFLCIFFVINRCSLIAIKTQCKRETFSDNLNSIISSNCSRMKYTTILLKLFKHGSLWTPLRSFLSQLNTEWAQVEVINLINDGSGLGFGIIGGRSTGVVVKTILPGGVADRVSK